MTFPLLYTELVQGNALELPQLLHLLQGGPAAVMGWEGPTLEPGQPADIVVLDLETERPVTSAAFRSKAKFSPWEGNRLRGWPSLTFVRGTLAFTAS